MIKYYEYISLFYEMIIHIANNAQFILRTVELKNNNKYVA